MPTEPKICVLIPAFNEEQVIAGTIDALRATGFNQSDIYIIDDMSTDQTFNIAQKCGVNVYAVEQKGGNKARAQLAGLSHYQLHNKYTHIVFLDGDTKVEPAFLNIMYAAAVKNPETTLFVGQVKSAENNHVFSALRAYDYTYGQDLVKRGQANFNVIFVSPGCASMYKLDDLMKLHLDDDTLAEDMDLTIQVHHNKGKIRYVHKAAVVTQDPDNLTDYHKQILRWYRGFWQIIVKHQIFGFTKKRPVDLYMMYLAVDSLLLNRVFTAITLCCLFHVPIVKLGLLVDVLIYAGVGVYVALRTRRFDVITKMPLYYWLSYLNLYAFLRSFVEVVVCRRKILAWNKVRRYAFS
jgi:cellulose synthase/poly-beta-1,6-N-acetylglucosamine synthase-like glycosyltransferase